MELNIKEDRGYSSRFFVSSPSEVVERFVQQFLLLFSPNADMLLLLHAMFCSETILDNRRLTYFPLFSHHHIFLGSFPLSSFAHPAIRVWLISLCREEEEEEEDATPKKEEEEKGQRRRKKRPNISTPRNNRRCLFPLKKCKL